MAQTQFLTFYICLTDPNLVATYQQTQWIPAVTVPGTIPLGIVNRAPYDPSVNGSGVPGGASIEFAAPFRGFSQPSGAGPYTWTPWYGAGIPDDEDGPFPLNVATFQRKSGGFLGLGGTTTRYYWMGQFVYVSDGTVSTGPGVPAPPTNLAQVLWIDGAELPGTAEGGPGGESGTIASSFDEFVSRDASRHVDGYGYAVRGETGGFSKQHLWNFYGAANPSTAWMRFYFRLRKLPTSGAQIWQCTTSTQAGNAITLTILPDGSIVISRLDTPGGGGQVSLGSTAPLTIGEWVCFDCLMKCGQNPPNDGRFRLYQNHVKVGDFAVTAQDGLGGAGVTPRLAATLIGSGASVFGGAWDFDDCSGHQFPINTDDESFLGADFQNGSRVTLVRPRIFDGGAGAWTGAVQSLQQNPPQASGGGLTSSTSGDSFQVTTDDNLAIGAVPGALGCTGIVVASYSERAAGAGTSQLGYSVAGGGPVMANIAVAATPGWDSVLYGPAFGTPLPTNPTPVKLRYIKPADASALVVKSLQAAALLIGQFGPEDVPSWSTLTTPGTAPGSPTTTAPVPVGIQLPVSADALDPLRPPAPAPFVIIAGTYTGNNAAQDLFFKIPAHFWRVRPLTGDTGGATWWSTMMAAHAALGEGTRAEVMVQALMDPDFAGAGGDEAQQFQAILRPTSANANGNANAVSFAYLAVCDPGQRFMLNGATRNQSGLASAAHPLVDADFLPEFGWFTHERANGSATVRFAVKGPGHGVDSFQVLTAAQQATAVSWTQGALALLTNVNIASFSQFAFNLWRSDDQTGDPNSIKVLRTFQYTGDGAGGNRTLTIPTPTLVCRPLYALIAPTNAGTSSYQRDHAHTTTSSTRIDTGGSSATAIVGGGIDQIIVGSTLNGNGVTYNVFVILAESAAGNGGWALPGEYVPVEPTTAPGTQWGDPFPGEPTTAPATVPPDLSTDLSTTCSPFSHKIVNLALHLIGSSQTITDLAADTSREGETIRLLYTEAVEQVLRDHPWRFATRYADLAWVAGEDTGDVDDKVNGDWLYSFRVPIDIVAARRLVRPELGRKFDPTPPPFKLGSDDTSDDRRVNGLVFTDYNLAEDPAVDVPIVELEYTARVPCPAGTGDALFRLALAWQLAHQIAPSLSKDEKRVAYCDGQYQAVLRRAQAQDRVEEQAEPDGDAEWIRARGVDGGTWGSRRN